MLLRKAIKLHEDFAEGYQLMTASLLRVIRNNLREHLFFFRDREPKKLVNLAGDSKKTIALLVCS